ncbi:uncharacterized protein AKAW2_50992A [Aspergillus luchuensis]|uniref:Uncharacterized protein n=1 Tax=Aspergillus kawachii TaxID=1069201 RepID=A0A7R8ABR8_ASPKA|nr:uncharacterized protein AKAW2_50992A [Aspergillus luchuensis]BCS00651.1 hypothetical protein AKAW2_50992A [Aspergillus luchuensis]BCS12417.1 hypothetical protein ALUC_50463A [Aspergillus luchuensis]
MPDSRISDRENGINGFLVTPVTDDISGAYTRPALTKRWASADLSPATEGEPAAASSDPGLPISRSKLLEPEPEPEPEPPERSARGIAVSGPPHALPLCFPIIVDLWYGSKACCASSLEISH